MSVRLALAWMMRWGQVAGAAVLLAAAPLSAARGAAITASSVHSEDFLPQYAADGDGQTRWASAAFAGRPQWLQIDFGKPVPLGGVVIQWERAHAIEYQLQVSADGRQWQTLHEERSGKGGTDVPANLSATGRFFRILCLKPSEFGIVSIWEVRFSGEADRLLAADRRRADEARRAEQLQSGRQLRDALLQHGVREIVVALRQPGKDGHWYANFSYYSDDENRLTYGNGGKLCRVNVASGEARTLLDDREGAVRDPVVHYDAGKVLFSYRKGGTPYYHLYEINVDGSRLRQLTDGPYDDIEPCYLPDGRIVFVSSRCNRWVNCWLTKVAVMHRCEADGTNVHPISANPEHENTPWPLPDGRLLYQRWEYVDRSQVDYHHLWTTHPDGTGQMVYFGNMFPGTVMIDAKPIPNGNKVVAIFSPGHGQREHDGVITVVDPRKGPDDRSLARSITREASFRDPWALGEELFLAAQGKRVVLVDGRGQTGEVYRVSPEEERAGLECHEPRPLMSRAREQVIPDRANRLQETGRLVLVDVYRGRNMEGVRRGEIKKLLVLETLPKPINFTGGMDPLTYGGSFSLERVLGTVPVEPDGSASMDLPALRALFFVALDANDMAVKRMQSFMTLQPGEVTSCVGCHEQRTQTALPRRDLAALARRPSQIDSIADCPDVFDFPRDVQPILDRRCVDCHDYSKGKVGGPYAGKIVLAGDRGPMFSHAYFTMTVRRLFSDNRNEPRSNLPPRTLGSSASRILGMLDGSHYDVRATDHEKRMLRLWIEVGAPYPGTYAALGCGAVGGYVQNEQVNTDERWPTTRAGAEVIQRRCAACHQGDRVLPKSLSDERDVSFWRFAIDDPRLKLSRHIVFNLTRPEKSLLLLAPLSAPAGGLGLCRDPKGNPNSVLAGTNDPDYATLLAMVAAGARNLDSIKRFDMPGFRPRPEYLREMRHYGVLPANHPADAPVDFYDLDRRYWQSLWHRAGAAGGGTAN